MKAHKALRRFFGGIYLNQHFSNIFTRRSVTKEESCQARRKIKAYKTICKLLLFSSTSAKMHVYVDSRADRPYNKDIAARAASQRLKAPESAARFSGSRPKPATLFSKMFAPFAWESTMNSLNQTPAQVAKPQTAPAETVLDFDSDEPLKVCPLRNEGSEICESCQ